MKISSSFSLLVVMAFCTYGTSCKKSTIISSDNSYGLPNAIQTGANIFACRINDSNWITKASILNLGTSFFRSNNRDTLKLSGSGSLNRVLDVISFSVFDKIQTGKSYRLNDTTKAFVNTLVDKAICF